MRQRAKEVKLPLSTNDLETCQLMMEYIVNSQDPEKITAFGLRPAVGLSAPQINISQKMFCINSYDETGKILFSKAFVNPKIVAFSEEKTYLPGGEGCLSVDESKNGLVPRSMRIKAKAFQVDLETGMAEPVFLKLSGYLGIVFQHEYDHLQGILFVDKVQPTLPGIRPIHFTDDSEN